jgi:hypothetical protein
MDFGYNFVRIRLRIRIARVFGRVHPGFCREPFANFPLCFSCFVQNCICVLSQTSLCTLLELLSQFMSRVVPSYVPNFVEEFISAFPCSATCASIVPAFEPHFQVLCPGLVFVVISSFFLGSGM